MLFDNAIKGLLSNLDPHSSYLTKSDMQELQTVTTGKFGGIGIEVIPEAGAIKIITPLDNSPASRAGIKAGDLIVRINKKLVKDMTLAEAIEAMRGPAGSKIKLTIIRENAKKPLVLTIKREVIKVATVKTKLLEKHYGYIRIALFQNPAEKDVEKAIQKLKKESNNQLLGIIIDVRNNPGGLFDTAISVTDLFLDADKLGENKLIVYTKGRHNDTNMKARATKGEIVPNLPIVVLINSGSASAAEILAGALQDHKRAIVVGTKSFGKGSVQTVLPINHESAMKLTTALYYTPKGRSIQADGIEPDVVVKDLKIANSDKQDILFDPINENSLRDPLKNGNGTKIEETPEEKAADKAIEQKLEQKDFQLYSALMLLKGVRASMKFKS